jgi:hypothetical protein
MKQCTRAAILAICIAAFPSAARAQGMAASFDDLSRVLKVGDLVYVTDMAGVTIWGGVHQLSESSLTVAIREQARDKGTITTTGEKRVFSNGDLTRISRSNPLGSERTLIYPPSWERVLSVPPRAELTVVLDTGEKRRYRFGSATADTLRLLASGGREETLTRAQIRRIVRHGVNDPSTDGLVAGALIGAGSVFAPTALAYGLCGAECYGRGAGSALVISTAIGAGIGAAIGWVIDEAHKGTDQVFPAPPARALRIDVLPTVGARARGLTVSLAF